MVQSVTDHFCKQLSLTHSNFTLKNVNFYLQLQDMLKVTVNFLTVIMTDNVHVLLQVHIDLQKGNILLPYLQLSKFLIVKIPLRLNFTIVFSVNVFNEAILIDYRYG